MTHGEPGSPTHTVHTELARMKRLKGESDEQLADRLYSWQMEIYSSYAMTDLWMPFWQLPEKVQQQWVEKASKYPKQQENAP